MRRHRYALGKLKQLEIQSSREERIQQDNLQKTIWAPCESLADADQHMCTSGPLEGFQRMSCTVESSAETANTRAYYFHTEWKEKVSSLINMYFNIIPGIQLRHQKMLLSGANLATWKRIYFKKFKQNSYRIYEKDRVYIANIMLSLQNYSNTPEIINLQIGEIYLAS